MSRRPVDNERELLLRVARLLVSELLANGRDADAAELAEHIALVAPGGAPLLKPR